MIACGDERNLAGKQITTEGFVFTTWLLFVDTQPLKASAAAAVVLNLFLLLSRPWVQEYGIGIRK